MNITGMIEIIIVTLLAYLIGSLSSAIIICRLMGLPDPRQKGSKNPVATNVLRIGGKKAAIITLLGDMLKGLIPVLFAQWLKLNPIGLAIIAFAAFCGHLFPIFFRFKGGKGVATLLGCLLALSWQSALTWMGTWFIIALIFRYVSLASLVASLLAPFFIWYFTHENALILATSLMSLILLYRHRQNMVNLFHGKENKIGKKIK